MANHEDDHKYAIVENEFRYLPYADTEGDADTKVDADIRILPPVTELDKTKRGHAFAHAVVCAVEARFHKKRNRCYPPKSMWRCSVKSLIKTMSTRLKLKGIWTVKTIDRLVSEYGIGLIVDEKHPEQCGPKYRGVHFQSFSSNDKSQYDKLFDEIRENGPIIAFFSPSDDFEDWSPELAKDRVYSGYSPSNKHVVALIGTSYFHDGSKYLIAQNCYGEEWGEKGYLGCCRRMFISLVFRLYLMPSHKSFMIKKKLAKKMLRYNAKRRHWRRTKLGF